MNNRIRDFARQLFDNDPRDFSFETFKTIDVAVSADILRPWNPGLQLSHPARIANS
jgi:hypothetical protein